MYAARHDDLRLSDTTPRQVMRNFSVNALYVFHEAVPVHASQERFRRASKSGRRPGKGAGGADGNGGTESQGKSVGGDDDGEGVGLRRVHRPPVNKLRLDVPELSSELDSSQVRSSVVQRVSKPSEKNGVRARTPTTMVLKVFSRESSGVGCVTIWTMGPFSERAWNRLAFRV